ncbi:MAG TPA: lipid-binding SYLF domain-containing protein [Bryobacteraceae bacterium]|jgi:lipid-binding SYLF domain-containing protein|nr:lipid-binding SYLF domain-containing protein [Bryobacteraceae bacterium]
MRKTIGFFALTAMTTSLFAASKDEVNKRLEEAATVFSEITAAPDKGIPQDTLEKAHCAVIVPGMKKGAFIVGAQYGKGFVTCRSGGGWSAPAAIKMEGGSFGLQIGGSETDVVMLVMNEHGAQKLMESQFTLGGEGEVAAGPVGRTATAETDAKLHAEILSWSRSRGVFAGISLKGATLRTDQEDNEALYGKKMDTKEVINGKVATTPTGRRLTDMLGKYAFRG